MGTEVPRWGSTVVRGSVHGRPTLMYEHRVGSVGALLREGRRWKDADFLVHGDRRITFAQHEAAVYRVADLLASRGIGSGDRVALFAANSPEWSVSFFATLEVGAIVVPCNGWWSASEVAHACSLTTPAIVVADRRRAERIPPAMDVLGIDELEEVWTVGNKVGDGHHSAVHEDDAAIILFTSGTTGFPKGATLSHRSIIANIQNLLVASRRLPHLIPDDHPAGVSLTSLPLFHIGAIQVLLLPFVTGARLVFHEGRFDPGDVLRIMEEEGVNTWGAVPTMAERVLAHPDLSRRDLASVRTIVLGGSAVSQDLLDRLVLAFPNANRGVGQTYGLSEAGGVLSTGVAKDLNNHRGSSGRIVPVAEIRIADPDPDGVGEIQARSPAVMDSYWGVPDDPVLTPDGWLRTGDLGWVDPDGFLYVTGRKKDMIIRGGENIAPAHIEACLTEHPHVLEAAVVGLPHPDLGEEVGAVVHLRPAADTSEADLDRFLRPRLAHFEVPARWWIIGHELPKSDNGKILKTRLRDEWVSRLNPRVEQLRE